MVTARRISCINKSDRTSIHEKIASVGGVHNNVSWRQSQEKTIQDIEENRASFYVDVEGTKAKVIVAKSASGHKYLKTEADGTTTDNLLSLPECLK